MSAMGEGGAIFFMAVGAQFSDGGCFGGLRMRVVAALAFDALLAMLAGAPFIGGRLVAFCAYFGSRLDRHGVGGMAAGHGAVTRFAGDSLLDIFAGICIKPGGMTFQAGGLLPQLAPVALEDR